MKFIIGIDNVDKMYTNPIINNVIYNLLGELGLPNSTRCKLQDDESDVENWNSGGGYRPLDGARDIVTYTVTENLSNIGEMESPLIENNNKPIFEDREVGLTIRPSFKKSFKSIDVVVSTISRTVAKRIHKYLHIRKRRNNRSVMDALGGFTVPESCFAIMLEINELKNIHESDENKLTYQEYIASIANRAVNLNANMAGHNAVTVDYLLSGIVVFLDKNIKFDFNYNKETNIYTLGFSLEVDLTIPIELEVTTPPIIFNKYLPDWLTKLDTRNYTLEDYIYYSELFERMVKNYLCGVADATGVDRPIGLEDWVITNDGQLVGEIINWKVVNGYVIEGPFTGVYVGYDFTGELTGVYINNCVYGGLLDGWCSNTDTLSGVFVYVYNDDGDVIGGRVIGGLISGRLFTDLMDMDDFEFLTGDIINGIVVTDKLSGVSINEKFIEETDVNKDALMIYSERINTRVENGSVYDANQILYVPDFDVHDTPLIIHDSYKTMMTLLMTVNLDDPRELFNLNDLGMYALDDWAIELIRLYLGNKLFMPEYTPILLTLYENDRMRDGKNLSLDPTSLAITCNFDLDPKKIYRITLSYLPDLSTLLDADDIIDFYKKSTEILNIIKLRSDGLIIRYDVPTTIPEGQKYEVMYSDIQAFMLKNKNIIKELK